MISGVSNFSGKVDMTFLFIAAVSVFFMALITVLMLYFLFRYNHKRNPQATEIRGNLMLEVIWTVIPTILVIIMFFLGLEGFVERYSAPADALQVEAQGRMWTWTFQYPDGIQSDVLRLPAGRAVRIDLTSFDVIHSLYIPAMRIKMDAVPGVGNSIWFTPEEEGEYEIFCAEFCGVRHSYMTSQLQVVSADDFDHWIADQKKSADAP